MLVKKILHANQCRSGSGTMFLELFSSQKNRSGSGGDGSVDTFTADLIISNLRICDLRTSKKIVCPPLLILRTQGIDLERVGVFAQGIIKKNKLSSCLRGNAKANQTIL
jgi:hypothetical protein